MTNDLRPDADLVRELTAMLMAQPTRPSVEDLLEAVSW